MANIHLSILVSIKLKQNLIRCSKVKDRKTKTGSSLDEMLHCLSDKFWQNCYSERSRQKETQKPKVDKKSVLTDSQSNEDIRAEVIFR